MRRNMTKTEMNIAHTVDICPRPSLAICFLCLFLTFVCSLQFYLFFFIQASISWIFSDNPVLTILVKAPVTKANITKITFSSDLDTVQLVIHEENIQSAHASATGSGNRLFAASFLLWFPAAVFLGFKRLCFVWTILTLSYSLGYAVPFDSDSLYVEILAPK